MVPPLEHFQRPGYPDCSPSARMLFRIDSKSLLESKLYLPRPIVK